LIFNCKCKNKNLYTDTSLLHVRCWKALASKYHTAEADFFHYAVDIISYTISMFALYPNSPIIYT